MKLISSLTQGVCAALASAFFLLPLPAHAGNFVNVITQGGAAGDGVTDDLPAITKSIALAGSGGTVFSPGTILMHILPALSPIALVSLGRMQAAFSYRPMPQAGLSNLPVLVRLLVASLYNIKVL
jgi:hypothetical protein